VARVGADAARQEGNCKVLKAHDRSVDQSRVQPRL
jgi:hypothetical protein